MRLSTLLVALFSFVSAAEASTTTSKQIDTINNSTGGSSLTVPSTGTTLVTDTNTLTLMSKTLDGSSHITSAVNFQDATDSTKQILFSLSGNTTGKTLTLSTAQTNTETLSIPNVSSGDSVCTINATQTLTNKTISAASNTLTTQWNQDTFFTCNGSTTAFTLTSTPSPTTGVIASLDGTTLIQGSGNDYTVSGTTLTLNTACSTGQRLLVIYEH